jgi:hypothetical protein
MGQLPEKTNACMRAYRKNTLSTDARFPPEKCFGCVRRDGILMSRRFGGIKPRAGGACLTTEQQEAYP